MCLFYFGGFPRNPVYRPIVCQLSGGERVNVTHIHTQIYQPKSKPLLIPTPYITSTKLES